MILNAADLFESVKLRRKLVGVIAGAVFLVVAIVTFVLPRQYEGTSSVLVDIGQSDPTDDAQKIQSQTVAESVMNTEMNVIQSNLVVEEVIRRAKLVTGEGSQKDREKEMEDAVKELRNHLTVSNDRQSNVMNISYLNTSAEKAAEVANLMSEVFLAKQVEVRSSPARQAATWFDKRAVDARDKYAAAQRKLSDFQRAHGIIGIDRMDLEAEKMKSLSAALVQAEADASAARSKAGSTNITEVAVSDSVQGIEQRRAVEAAHVADLAKTLGPNHPQMVAARAELGELDAALSSARSTQASALSGASSAASRHEADLRAQLAKQQETMIRLSAVQDDLMVLQRDVDTAQKTYEAIRSKVDETRLKSEIAQANASPLDRAVPPVLPAKPKVLLLLAAGLVLGALIGVATALFLELITPRVRTPQGLQTATDVEVLADLSRRGSAGSPAYEAAA